MCSAKAHPQSAPHRFCSAPEGTQGGWEIVSLVTFAMDNVLLIFGNNNILDDWYGLQDEEDASMKPQMPDGLHPLLTLCFLVCLQCSFSHVRLSCLWGVGALFLRRARPVLKTSASLVDNR